MSERYPAIRLRDESNILTVRDGIIVCFFMRRNQQDIAPAVWRALQTYVRAIPPGSLAWYGTEQGDTDPLDATAWQYIREKILERPEAVGCHVDLWEHEYEACGYNFQYVGRKIDDPLFSRDENATCGIAFTFPTEYLLEHGAAHLRALAIELSRELPFSSGYASLAFLARVRIVYPRQTELHTLLSRYLGLDYYSLDDTSDAIGTGARGAYWLNFLGQPLLGQLGGLDVLRQQLPFPEVSFEQLDSQRALLTLGEWPSALDTREGPPALPYRTLARLLEPYFPNETFPVRHIFDRETMPRWLRRLCQ
jgi:hypothetical protein